MRQAIGSFGRKAKEENRQKGFDHYFAGAAVACAELAGIIIKELQFFKKSIMYINTSP